MSGIKLIPDILIYKKKFMAIFNYIIKNIKTDKFLLNSKNCFLVIFRIQII